MAAQTNINPLDMMYILHESYIIYAMTSKGFAVVPRSLSAHAVTVFLIIIIII